MRCVNARANRKMGGAMSTRASLNYCVDEATGATAHLYEEYLLPDDAPVYLNLTGVREASFDTVPLIPRDH